MKKQNILSLGLLLNLAFVSNLYADEKGKEVLAVYEESGDPVFAGQLVQSRAKTMEIQTRNKDKVTLAPQSVAEFVEDGKLRLLRGSAIVVSHQPSKVYANGFELAFQGSTVISYDYKERSTSAFMAEGEGEVKNPSEPENSVHLDRFRGATLEVGQVFPKLVRQLDFSSLDDWLKGYLWSKSVREELLSFIPKKLPDEIPKGPEYLRDQKLEDYYSSFEALEESDKPDYYRRKFADPDEIIAEGKANASQKEVSPEEAAMIKLPSVTIDLGFDLPPAIISKEQKARELKQISKKKIERKLASINAEKVPVKAYKIEVKTEGTVSDGQDPDVRQILERLREIKKKDPIVSGQPHQQIRGPASVSVVPDPVYNYSENF